MKKLILALIILGIGYNSSAQQYQVPKNYKFETADDYKTYEQEILDCIDWLLATPLNSQPEKRKEANLFFFTWLTGSPTVTVEIHEYVMDFSRNPEYLFIFMAGWTKFSLENPGNKDKFLGHMAGVENVVNYYNSHKNSIGKDKKLEKFVKMEKQGKLEEFVRKKVS